MGATYIRETPLTRPVYYILVPRFTRLDAVQAAELVKLMGFSFKGGWILCARTKSPLPEIRDGALLRSATPVDAYLWRPKRSSKLQESLSELTTSMILLLLPLCLWFLLRCHNTSGHNTIAIELFSQQGHCQCLYLITFLFFPYLCIWLVLSTPVLSVRRFYTRITQLEGR